MPGLLAVIELSFDPTLRLGDLAIRWQTIGVTVALLAAFALAARVVPTAAEDVSQNVRRAPHPQFPDAPSIDRPRAMSTVRALRLDDLVLIVAGVVPGAVVGGRLMHAVAFWEAYAAAPLSVFDPGVGSLSLLGAVVGGALSGGYVARLVGAPIYRWADAAAIPLLLALALGKLAQLLGGSGQGLPFQGTWAVAFTGAGPWVSANPALPSHPSQLYEAAWYLVGIPVVLLLSGSRSIPSRLNPRAAWADRATLTGQLFINALAWFLLGRLVVGFTWRDPSVLGPFNLEQIAAALLLVTLLAFRLRAHGYGGNRIPSGVAPVVALALIMALPVAPVRAGQALTIDERISAMSLEEKVGQLFVVSFYGDEANETNVGQRKRNLARLGVPTAAALIDTYHVGGVVYFRWAGNLRGARQIARLSNQLQTAALAQPPTIPLLISTDQEGGAVTRLPAAATGFPGNMALGATRDAALAREAAVATGRELRAVGINQNLAPVADVNVNPANPVIGVRSYSSSPELVAAMTSAQVRGYELDAGVAATAKHFPGHGDTNVDSHSGLPVIDHSLDEWRAIDAPPFRAAIDAGVGVVMTAHVSVPALDATGRPATLSEPIISGRLRDELGFEGVVITDSLGMAGVRRMFSDDRIPVLALQAGADMLLMPPSLPVAYEAVLNAVRNREISTQRLDQSVRRILELKESLGLFQNATVVVSNARNVVGAETHRATERAVASAAATLLVNEGGMLPLSPRAGASFLIIGTSTAVTTPLVSTLRARGFAAASLAVGDRPSSSAIDRAVNSAPAHDYVVVLTRNADANGSQRTLVAELADAGRPLVTASVARPYDVAYLNAPTHVALYSASPASIRAFARLMLGEMSPTGRLPVSIPVAGNPDETLFEFGFGLAY